MPISKDEVSLELPKCTYCRKELDCVIVVYSGRDVYEWIDGKGYDTDLPQDRTELPEKFRYPHCNKQLIKEQVEFFQRHRGNCDK